MNIKYVCAVIWTTEDKERHIAYFEKYTDATQYASETGGVIYNGRIKIEENIIST